MNSKDNLLKALYENNGRIRLPHCMLSINYVSCDDLFEYIYVDGYEDIDHDEDILVEFCDSHMMTVASILWKDIEEFELVFEYDENGYIKN